MIIGITGGIAAGKTTVLRILKEKCGALIFCADEFGHMAFNRDSQCYQRIVDVFGKEILDEQKDIDREIVAEIVYSDERKLRKLDEIIHPFVWQQIEKGIKNAPEDQTLIVIESAILIEAGYENICDVIWGIFCPEEVRIKRLQETRGYTKQKAKSIIKNQMTEWELRSYCSEMIENNGDMDDLEKQICELVALSGAIQ